MKTILIVDDESSIRRLMSAVAAREGYAVLEAESGEQALQIAAAHQGCIDLLITDVCMSCMDGWELASRLCEQRPSLSVVYISGHCTEPARSLAGVNAEFLAKPFTVRQLLAAVERVLSGVQISAYRAGE